MKSKNSPRGEFFFGAMGRLFDIFREIVIVQILMEVFHVLILVFFKILPYNGYESVGFGNILFTFLFIAKLFITSGDALKKTPMECLHTGLEILIGRIIIQIVKKERGKHAKSFLIAFQCFGDVIIGRVIAELNVGMLIHEEPSVAFLHTGYIQVLQMMASRHSCSIELILSG